MVARLTTSDSRSRERCRRRPPGLPEARVVGAAAEAFAGAAQGGEGSRVLRGHQRLTGPHRRRDQGVGAQVRKALEIQGDSGGHIAVGLYQLTFEMFFHPAWTVGSYSFELLTTSLGTPGFQVNPTMLLDHQSHPLLN